MDVNGKTKKSIGLKKKARGWNKTVDEIMEWNVEIRISDNEKYIGLLIPRNVNMLEGMSMGDMVIYNVEGEEQWRLDSVFLSDGDIKISPNGEYALGNPPAEVNEGYPYYYDKEGMRELGKLIDEYIHSKGICFSPDGKYFIITMEREYQNVKIIKINKDLTYEKSAYIKNIICVNYITENRIIIKKYDSKKNKTAIALLDGALEQIITTDYTFSYRGYNIQNNWNRNSIYLTVGVEVSDNIFNNEFYELSLNDLSIKQKLNFNTDDRITGMLSDKNKIFYGENGIYKYISNRIEKLENLENLKVKIYKTKVLIISNNRIKVLKGYGDMDE